MLGRPSLWSADLLSAFLIGAAAGYGIAIPVGPIAVLIVRTGLRRGFRVAAAAGAGTATVDLVYATIALVVGGRGRGALASGARAGASRGRRGPDGPRGRVACCGSARRSATVERRRHALGVAHVSAFRRAHASQPRHRRVLRHARGRSARDRAGRGARASLRGRRGARRRCRGRRCWRRSAPRCTHGCRRGSSSRPTLLSSAILIAFALKIAARRARAAERLGEGPPEQVGDGQHDQHDDELPEPLRIEPAAERDAGREREQRRARDRAARARRPPA